MYAGPCQTTVVEIFTKNGELFPQKASIIDARKGSKYTCEEVL